MKRIAIATAVLLAGSLMSTHHLPLLVQDAKANFIVQPIIDQVVNFLLMRGYTILEQNPIGAGQVVILGSVDPRDRAVINDMILDRSCYPLWETEGTNEILTILC